MTYYLLLAVSGGLLAQVACDDWNGSKASWSILGLLALDSLALSLFMPMPIAERLAGGFVWTLPIAALAFARNGAISGKDVALFGVSGLYLGTQGALLTVIFLGLVYGLTKQGQRMRQTLTSLNAPAFATPRVTPDISLALPLSITIFCDLQIRLFVFSTPEGPSRHQEFLGRMSLDHYALILGALLSCILWRLSQTSHLNGSHHA